MKHEILLEKDCSAEEFLSLLYQQYPYDIERKMVFTLLDKDTYPHPALLKFISYFAQFPKYRISTFQQDQDIDSLCARMSQLIQNNKTTLHTYVFHFDASIQITPYKVKSPYAHLCLTTIPFISNIQLHTIPILSMSSPYSDRIITKSKSFLFKDISIDANAYYAISIQISDKRGIIYFPRDQIGIGIAISMLYEVVPPSTDIDFLLLYGLSTHTQCLSYYFDETNQLYIGLVAGNCFAHFKYVMQMITTLYNAICIEKSDLPVQACMLEIENEKQKYGVLLMGDEHTGKSELCDNLRTYCKTHQIPCTCVFESCGTLHYLDNEICATGMQIGACVSIHGLSKESIFKKIPACAFLKNNNVITHMLFPFTSIKETMKFHKVHALFYLNNVDKQSGCRKINDLTEAKQLFVQDCPKKTKSKKAAFFCNRLGCEQQKHEVSLLIDHYFNIMMINDLYLGEIYTLNKRYRNGKCLQDILQHGL